ncbi:hypothetical protein MMC20_006915 [Loxospora ochrophaea]|nr:hypothetical protein [Loxospora ochrophaea]
MSYSSSLKLHAKTTNRVFPESFPTSARTVPLSIIDATVANFGASSAIWFYDAPRALTPATSASHWQASLEKTLNAYPQWCGQLHWSSFDPRGNHTHRFGRLNIVYGTKSDPGVHLVVAKSPLILDSLLPDPSQRTSDLKFWEASQLPAKEFFPSKPPLAMHNMVDYISLPSLIIHVTTFACGGTTIAIKLAHPLADAHTLAFFAHDWASTSHAMFANSPLPILSPIFDPQLLENAAAGNIDATTPDPWLVQQARTLPCLRYDWWASAPQLSDGPAITKIPEELRQSILQFRDKSLRCFRDFTCPPTIFLATLR